MYFFAINFLKSFLLLLPAMAQLVERVTVDRKAIARLLVRIRLVGKMFSRQVICGFETGQLAFLVVSELASGRYGELRQIY